MSTKSGFATRLAETPAIGNIIAFDKLPVFDGTGFKAWFRKLQVVMMANNLMEVMSDTNKPVPVDASKKTPEETKDLREWNRLEQKAITLITLSVSPAIGSLFESNFKVTPATSTTAVSYSISSRLTSSTSTLSTTTINAATPALMIQYLRDQYGAVSLGTSFDIFKRAFAIRIPSSGSPVPAMNQLKALMNELVTDGVVVPDYIHAMILINALPPVYNMATFLTAITAPADLKALNVRTTVTAMYVNSPNLTSGSSRQGEDRRNGNIATKISDVKRKPATDPKWRSQTAPGAPYASGSGSGNQHARHDDQRNNNGRGCGSGRGGRGGGRGGPKRQDKGKGHENSAHIANDASGGNFAAHAVSGPSQVSSAPEPRSLIDRISAPADPLSAEDLDLVDSKLAAGRLRFGVAPGSDHDVELRRIVRSHIVERRRLLDAEYAVKPAHAPEHPVSASLASCLDPHLRVARDLSRKQRKALKDDKALGRDRLGAPSVITGTYRDQCYELPLPPRVAEMGAKIDASYRLDQEGLSSDDDSNASEPDDAWFERADAINAQETRKLSVTVLLL
jgi:hypothetical protein